MTSIIYGFVLISVAFAARPELDERWESFKEAFNKAYAGEAEEGNRREIWELNYDKIQQHNADFQQGLHTYSLGENSYADLSSEEFAATVLMTQVPEMLLPMPPIAPEEQDDTLPASVDWRKKGVVTPIKDQKQCGSCWAFSATGSVEGAHAIKTGKLVSLSEQNLVDCAGPEGNMGCGGGFPDWGMQYVIDNKGIDTEDSYPYEAENEKCHFNKSTIGATISSYTMIKVDSDAELLKAVATVGPISIGMDAGHESFQLYKSGIYSPTDCSKTMLDHGVLIVGYGEEKGKKYWIVKNSWGTSWGLDGYFLLGGGGGGGGGVSTRASYPTV